MTITLEQSEAVFDEYGQDHRPSLVPSVLPSLVEAFTEWANDMAMGDAESAYRAAFRDGCYRGEFSSDGQYADTVADLYGVPSNLTSWLVDHGMPEFVAQSICWDSEGLALVMQNTPGLNFSRYGLHVFTEEP